MASKGKKLNKTAFLRELFRKSPEVNIAGANEAWTKAGNEEKISDSLYYAVKAEVSRKADGGAGEAGEAVSKPLPEASPSASQSRRVGRPPSVPRPETDGKTAPSPYVASMTGERERVLDKVEDRLDDLIIELKTLGGMDEALEALRKVRRVVVRSHEG